MLLNRMSHRPLYTAHFVGRFSCRLRCYTALLHFKLRLLLHLFVTLPAMPCAHVQDLVYDTMEGDEVEDLYRLISRAQAVLCLAAPLFLQY
jgi:hypothetical protein